MDAHTRSNVLGVGISAVNLGLALETIRRWIDREQSHYICVRDVHGIMQSRWDPALRRIHNRAGMVVPDGMPLVWLSRAAGHRHVDRCYGPDLMLAVCAASQEHGWKHYLYGGAEGVADRLAMKLCDRFPALKIVGSHCPPFRPLTDAEDQEVIERINASGADIVWVGLGTPKQERWMADHVRRIKRAVLIGVGAAFDFHAGLKPQAPRWIQRSGFEWLFRMCTEPRRLGKRYLRTHPQFLGHLLLQKTGLGKYPMDDGSDNGGDEVD